MSKVTDAIPKTEASGSEEECHSADDVLTVGHVMIGDCSRESKTDSELEHFWSVEIQDWHSSRPRRTI